VEIVKTYIPAYGLNATLAVIELPKSIWYYWRNKKASYEEKYGHLKEPLIQVLAEHPEHGYRRVEPELMDKKLHVRID